MKGNIDEILCFYYSLAKLIRVRTATMVYLDVCLHHLWVQKLKAYPILTFLFHSPSLYALQTWSCNF